METTTIANIMENKIIEISMVAITGIMQGNMRNGNPSGQFYAIHAVTKDAKEVIDYIQKENRK